jgi:desulfoferrodoxin (superoxide reductase-like protein)
MRTGKPITIRAYLNIKGISYNNNIYTALKGLKMAREEGMEVYAYCNLHGLWKKQL